ncbi:cation transporter [Microbaculum marinum]|uniref:Cation transporter n=1 Tax=Microbaculum marinum TaxID=1764581 RepID=A0AAW9RLR5_9HYPH
MIKDLDPLDQEPAPVSVQSDELLAPVTAEQEGALKAAALMGLALAGFEAVVALLIGSVAVMAIAIDSFHDALTAGTTLVLAGRHRRLYRLAAVVVSVLIAFAFLWMIWIGFTRFGVGRIPSPWLMIAVAVISLAVNLISAWRLRVFSSGDDDVRWVWRQTRWDFAADLGVIVAALAISDFAQRWPDLAAGLLIAAFNIWGVWKLVRSMWEQEAGDLNSAGK